MSGSSRILIGTIRKDILVPNCGWKKFLSQKSSRYQKFCAGENSVSWKSGLKNLMLVRNF